MLYAKEIKSFGFGKDVLPRKFTVQQNNLKNLLEMETWRTPSYKSHET